MMTFVQCVICTTLRSPMIILTVGTQTPPKIWNKVFYFSTFGMHSVNQLLKVYISRVLNRLHATDELKKNIIFIIVAIVKRQSTGYSFECTCLESKVKLSVDITNTIFSTKYNLYNTTNSSLCVLYYAISPSVDHKVLTVR